MSTSTKRPASKPQEPAAKPAKSTNVSLPPIDATPEEIARTLFQRPPKKKPAVDDSDAV